MIHNDCYNTLHCLIRLTSGPSIHFIGSFGFGFRTSLLFLVYYSSMGQLITVEPWSPRSRLQITYDIPLHFVWIIRIIGSYGQLFLGVQGPMLPALATQLAEVRS